MYSINNPKFLYLPKLVPTEDLRKHGRKQAIKSKNTHFANQGQRTHNRTEGQTQEETTTSGM